MTVNSTVDFMRRLRIIDNHALKVRDPMVLWAIAREGGMTGREIATKLGYPSRSRIQDGIVRLLKAKMIEDRRVVENQLTPMDLYITPIGEKFLSDVLPA